MTNERILLEKARAFHQETLGEIYDSYSPGIFRYGMRLLGDSDLAEECVSETFSRFLNALKNGGGPADHLQAYLYRIAHNWITDHYRRQPPLPLELDEEFHNEDDDPVQHAMESMEKMLVRKALFLLTTDQRQVIVLKFIEGWSNDEVSVAVGKPVTAVKSLQHRALSTLRRLLLSEVEQEGL